MAILIYQQPPNPLSPAGHDMASPSLLTDDLLSDIFLRLDDPADLVRTAAACVPFRRLVSDRVFLRWFRSLHPAPFLGFLDQNGFHSVLPPHASTPVARAVSLAADFSFSFLSTSSTGGGWVVRDVRDSRVLLDRSPEYGGEVPQAFTEIAVCDPLHRRSVLLPPIPDDLAITVEHPLRLELDRWCEPFLAPHGAYADVGDPEDNTSFGVICMVQCKAKLVAVAFSSNSGQWRAVASLAWRDLMSGLGVSSISHASARRQYARGCFYWVMDWREKFLVLDAGRMEFSIAGIPPGCHRRQIGVVEAGEGRVGMFVLQDHVADGAVSLNYIVRRDDIGCNSNRWQLEKIIPLDPGYRYYMRGGMERYMLLLRFPEHQSSSAEMEELECFSMDGTSLQLEKVCKLNHHIMRAYVYTNFPPALSPQSI